MKQRIVNAIIYNRIDKIEGMNVEKFMAEGMGLLLKKPTSKVELKNDRLGRVKGEDWFIKGRRLRGQDVCVK